MCPRNRKQSFFNKILFRCSVDLFTFRFNIIFCLVIGVSDQWSVDYFELEIGIEMNDEKWNGKAKKTVLERYKNGFYRISEWTEFNAKTRNEIKEQKELRRKKIRLKSCCSSILLNKKKRKRKKEKRKKEISGKMVRGGHWNLRRW